MRFLSERPRPSARRPAAAILFLALGLAAAPRDAWAGPGIQPHSATYAMVLDRSKPHRGLADARGRIDFKWIEGCDGWTVEQRTVLVMTDMEGADYRDAWALKAWESKDGLSYSFSLETTPFEGEPTVLRGRARLTAAGGPGEARFADGEPEPLALPAGTMFPTAYSKALMDAAAAGEFLFWRHVFDGSGDGELFGVNAAILETLPRGARADFGSPVIDGLESWRMRLTYFETGRQDGEPDHEMGQRVYANGVVDELEFDYEDFSLRASLQSLEALARPDCKP